MAQGFPEAAHVAAAADASGPKVVGCSGADARKVQAAWAGAVRLAEAALRWLAAVVRSRSRSQMWAHSPARALFGPFRVRHMKRAVRVFAEALRRLREGYRSGRARRPTTVECMPASGRCGKGLLGNASIYGRVRLCPRLLARGVDEIAAVVLHEVMHHRLGVGDQRHDDCVGDRKQRCYRDNAHALVAAERFDLASRNIDNFVLFARAIARSK